MAILIRKFFGASGVAMHLLEPPSRIAYLVYNTDKSLFIGCPDNLFRKFIEFSHYSFSGTSHHSTSTATPSRSIYPSLCRIHFDSIYLPTSSLDSNILLICCRRRFTITHFTETEWRILRFIWRSFREEKMIEGISSWQITTFWWFFVNLKSTLFNLQWLIIIISNQTDPYCAHPPDCEDCLVNSQKKKKIS